MPLVYMPNCSFHITEMTKRKRQVNKFQAAKQCNTQNKPDQNIDYVGVHDHELLPAAQNTNLLSSQQR